MIISQHLNNNVFFQKQGQYKFTVAEEVWHIPEQTTGQGRQREWKHYDSLKSWTKVCSFILQGQICLKAAQ